MLKICMLDPLFFPYPGGAEKHVYEVSKRLCDEHDITVLTSRLPNTKPKETLDNINVIRTPSLYLENLPSFLPPPYTISPLLIRDLLSIDADIFHIHNRFWYFFGTLAAIKLIKKKRLFITLHNARPSGISFLIDKGGSLFDDIWGKRMMEASDRILAVSDYTLNVTVPESLHKKSRVVHNGVDINRFAPRSGKSIREKFGIGSEYVILCNARLVEQKGIKYLIWAFAMLKSKYKDAKLIIIGKGPLKAALVYMCQKLKIQDSVFFTTGIPEEELPLYYNASDIFVLPSVWEPCALVILESLSSGLPVVASAVGGNDELITNDCGILVPPRDPKAIFENITLLLDDPKLRRKMGENARARAVKNFSWDIVAAKLDYIYKEVENEG